MGRVAGPASKAGMRGSDDRMDSSPKSAGPVGLGKTGRGGLVAWCS